MGDRLGTPRAVGITFFASANILFVRCTLLFSPHDRPDARTFYTSLEILISSKIGRQSYREPWRGQPYSPGGFRR